MCAKPHPKFPKLSSATPKQLSTPAALSPFIEHTLLRADATKSDIKRLAAEAVAYGFVAACVNLFHLETLIEALGNSLITPVVVVGFPLGATLPSAKAFETQAATKLGAKEVDMTLNIGALKARDYTWVRQDIEAVVQAAAGAWVKVIIETALLTEEEKEAACHLSQQAGAHFVKTCTGFAGGKATEADIALMRRAVGDSMGIKASGGIATAEVATALLLAGANRLGTSSGVKLVRPNEESETGHGQ